METEVVAEQMPSSEPSKAPLPSGGNRRRGNPSKLVPGVKAGQRRGPDGRLLPKKPKEPVLSNDSEGELAAMRWVTTHAASDDRTWEQKSAREFKEASPARFYDRKARLEEAASEAEKSSTAQGCAVDPKWDGIGACPTCGYEAEKAIEDGGSAKIRAMLAELKKGRGE